MTPIPYLVRPLPVALLLSFAIGCGESGEVPVEELFSAGPYDVGLRKTTITYDEPVSGEDRTLEMLVWYPAVADSAAASTTYGVAGLLSVDADLAVEDAQLADGGPFPLAIYSHGSGGEAWVGYKYGELMATHGWVVAAPSHTGNTTLDAVAETSFPLARTALYRPADITATLDWVESGLGDDPLAGNADTTQVFVFGHSFGGFTTFAAGGADADFDGVASECDEESEDPNCVFLAGDGVEAAFRAGFGDSRVVAIAPQAPVGNTFSASEFANLEVPTMLMSARLDQTLPDEEHAMPAWMGLDHPDDIWVEMPNGAHFSFISLCDDLQLDTISALLPGVADDGCGPQFTPTADAVPVLVAYVLAFGRLHVLGEGIWESALRGPPLGDGFEITVR